MEGERLGNEGEGEVKEGREGGMKSRRDGSNERERENGGIHVPIKEKKKDRRREGGGICIMDGER